MLLIPGWEGKIKDEPLFLTQCRIINDYGEEYIHSKIRSGDFLSSYPFGIIKKDNNYSVLTLDRPNDAIKIEYSSIVPNDCSESVSTYETIERFPLAVSELIFTSLVELLCSNGFTRPIETRGFLGRQSKGIISNRQNPIDSYQLSWQDTKRNFSLCPAEIVRVSLFAKERKFFLTYHPRFEIFEDDFFLPQYADVREELMDNWHSTILMNPEKVTQRLQGVSPIITKLKGINRIIQDIAISSAGHLEEGLIKFPKLKSVGREVIQGTSSDEISEKLQNTFKKELKLFIKLRILIIADDSEKKRNRTILARLRAKLKELGVETVSVDFDPAKHLNETFFSSTNAHDAILYILDNDLNGSDGRYSIFKDLMFKLVYPNKVIRYLTLHDKNEDEFSQIILLNLLGFLYRFSRTHVWTLCDELYDLTIAISETRRFNAYVEILSASLFYSGKRKNVGALKLRNEEQKDYLYLDGLKKEIKDVFSDSLQNKKILVLVDSEDFSELIKEFIDWLNEFKAEPLLVEIFERDEGRILEKHETEKNGFMAPNPGSYVKIGETKYFSDYLLVTTEQENESNIETDENDTRNIGKKKLGLPRPLRVRIYSTEMLDHIRALKYIFWNTFLHPTSFVRPKMPIDLVFAKKNQELVFKSKLYGITNEWSVL